MKKRKKTILEAVTCCTVAISERGAESNGTEEPAYCGLDDDSWKRPTSVCGCQKQRHNARSSSAERCQVPHTFVAYRRT